MAKKIRDGAGAVAGQKAAARKRAIQKPGLKERVSDSNAPEPESESAFKSLRRAVGKEVSKKSGQIAKSLVQGTLDGNANSARIVMALVDKRAKKSSQPKRAGAKGESRRSAAIDLAAEPQWKDEDEKDGATQDGSREESRDTDEAQ